MNRDSYHDEILSINSKKATKKSLSNNDTFIELPKMKSKKSITNSFFGKKKGLDDLNISEIENTSQYNLTFIDTNEQNIAPRCYLSLIQQRISMKVKLYQRKINQRLFCTIII